jgi:hypothetical protein
MLPAANKAVTRKSADDKVVDSRVAKAAANQVAARGAVGRKFVSILWG